MATTTTQNTYPYDPELFAAACNGDITWDEYTAKVGVAGQITITEYTDEELEVMDEITELCDALNAVEGWKAESADGTDCDAHHPNGIDVFSITYAAEGFVWTDFTHSTPIGATVEAAVACLTGL